MENDAIKAIETTASTNNDGNEDLIVSAELVDEEKRFEDGDRVEGNDDQ